MVERVRLLHDARAAIGEAPLCRGADLWWTDPVSRMLLHASGAELRRLPVDAAIWSLAALPDGGMAGSLDDRFARIGEDGAIVAGPAGDVAAGCRFNDMAVGPDGSLWVGAMHRGLLAGRGALYRAASIEEWPVRVAEGLGVPNGMKVSADGSTLFVVDTLQRTLLAYPVTVERLGEPTIVTDFLGLAGKPDGMALVPNGGFWVAMWGGGAVVRIAPDGATLREIAVPAPHVGSLCLTDDGRLLVSTARMRLSPQALADYPGSGGVFEIVPESAT